MLFNIKLLAGHCFVTRGKVAGFFLKYFVQELEQKMGQITAANRSGPGRILNTTY